MILCLNANAALDRILFIERFVPKTHMRTHDERLCVGGKGLDTALVLQALGAPVRAVSFIAGRNGQIIDELIQKAGLPSELIWLSGETRIATVIVETGIQRHSHITSSGYHITPHDCCAFIKKVSDLAPQATWAVIAGTLPPGAPTDFYAQLTQVLHQHGVRVLVDAVGAPLYAAFAAKPDIVKMNQAEFSETFEINGSTIDSLPQACRKVMEHFALQSIVVTCGKHGILACTPDSVYHAGGPEVSEVNAAGAGDAVSAALVYHFSLGDGWEQALPWASATGAAVLLTPGTAECYLDDVKIIYQHSWVKIVNP